MKEWIYLKLNLQANANKLMIINSKAEEVIVSQHNNKIKLFENFKSNYKKKILRKESYDKQANVLIHGIQENPNNVWEKREKNN